MSAPKEMPTGDPKNLDTGGSFPTFSYPDYPHVLESKNTVREGRHEHVVIIPRHGLPALVQFANGRDQRQELTWDDYVKQFGFTPRSTVAVRM